MRQRKPWQPLCNIPVLLYEENCPQKLSFGPTYLFPEHNHCLTTAGWRFRELESIIFPGHRMAATLGRPDPEINSQEG